MGDSVTIPPGYEMQSGAGAPASDLGMDTDRYLDTASGDFYQKINGAWVKQTSFGGLRLQLLGTATVGETLTLGVSLGVRRYDVSVSGAAVGDRIILTLTGAPQNGSLQEGYAKSAGTVNVALLVPALALGAVVAVPVAIYKVI